MPTRPCLHWYIRTDAEYNASLYIWLQTKTDQAFLVFCVITSSQSMSSSSSTIPPIPGMPKTSIMAHPCSLLTRVFSLFGFAVSGFFGIIKVGRVLSNQEGIGHSRTYWLSAASRHVHAPIRIPYVAEVVPRLALGALALVTYIIFLMGVPISDHFQFGSLCYISAVSLSDALASLGICASLTAHESQP